MPIAFSGKSMSGFKLVQIVSNSPEYSELSEYSELQYEVAISLLIIIDIALISESIAGMGVLTRSQSVMAREHKLPVTLLSGFLGAGTQHRST